MKQIIFLLAFVMCWGCTTASVKTRNISSDFNQTNTQNSFSKEFNKLNDDVISIMNNSFSDHKISKDRLIDLTEAAVLVQMSNELRAIGVLDKIKYITEIYPMGINFELKSEYQNYLHDLVSKGDYCQDFEFISSTQHKDKDKSWWRQIKTAGEKGLHIGVSNSNTHQIHMDQTNPVKSKAWFIPNKCTYSIVETIRHYIDINTPINSSNPKPFFQIDFAKYSLKRLSDSIKWLKPQSKTAFWIDQERTLNQLQLKYDELNVQAWDIVFETNYEVLIDKNYLQYNTNQLIEEIIRNINLEIDFLLQNARTTKEVTKVLKDIKKTKVELYNTTLVDKVVVITHAYYNR